MIELATFEELERANSPMRLDEPGVRIYPLSSRMRARLDDAGFGRNNEVGELVGEFDGLHRAIDFIINRTGKYGLGRDWGSVSKVSCGEGRGSGWCKGNTIGDSLRLMLEEPTKLFKTMVADGVINDVDNAGKGVSFENAGDYLDVGRFLEGSPEAFGVMREGRVSSKFCTVNIFMANSAGVADSDIEAKANAVNKLVDFLEANRVRCELNILSHNSTAIMTVRLKKFGEPLIRTDLGVAMSSDFYRRVIFRFREHSETHAIGYGSSLELRNLKCLADPDAPHTIVVGHHTGPESVREVERLIERLSIEGLTEPLYIVGD